MRSKFFFFVGFLFLAGGIVGTQATDRFVALDGGHVAPFTSWADAATNIQVAIDAASAGDTVWVTNGVYSTGGKVMAGSLTNRIAVDKALLVSSVNGPGVTIIHGAWDTIYTNGPGAVRCAWLTNGATLSGFTLRGGATHTGTSMVAATNCGGAVWSVSLGSVVTNCTITGNAAYVCGGGVFSNTVVNSVVASNVVTVSGLPTGGGAYESVLKNCAVLGNRIPYAFAGSGGGAYRGALTNCTVVGNFAYGGSGVSGSSQTPVMNCIVWGNTSPATSATETNVSIAAIVRYSCTGPRAGGAGNLFADPQLLADSVHLATTSPCRGTGNAGFVTGVDIDARAWSNPPSIGCDEWSAEPLILRQPKILPGREGRLQISLAFVTGQEPITYFWFKDGAALSGDNYAGRETGQLTINKLGPADAGTYQVVASNAFGMATSAVATVTVRCVNIAGISPIAPFADWVSAATNIQMAIEASAVGDIVLVTNGVYGFGGKVMAGDLTNRVVIDKGLIVMSVNGAAETFIVGTPGLGGINASLPPNGPNAVRCVWLGKDAILSGFTLRGGGTRITSGTYNIATDCGGGVWCASPDGLVTYCVIQENSSNYQGGGCYGGTFNNCTITANGAGWLYPNPTSYFGYGGGAYNAVLNNCLVRGNAAGNGGGTHNSGLNNCTVIGNFIGGGFGSGTRDSVLRNCIVRSNLGSTSANVSGGDAQFCCVANILSGSGNITNDPLFLIDGVHLSSLSPCRNAGSPAFTSGTDVDGQLWTNPPSMGCDQWLPEPLILDFKMQASHWNQFDFKTLIAGIESSHGYWLKDGAALSESAHYVGAETTGLTVQGLSASDSGNYQLIVSNAFGMATSRVAELTIRFVNAENPGATPYTNWQTAAGTIQEAIDAAAVNDVILVTNGIYNRGGKALSAWDVTNRIFLEKSVAVVSVNGPFQTAIEGRWEPNNTNGPGAVRCALVWSNSSLAGFTLRNGATGTNGSGGGVAVYSDELVASCVISNNRAWHGGGGDWGRYVNCLFIGNAATYYGGGVSSARGLQNCTIVENTAAAMGGGAYLGQAMTNCIVWCNSAPSFPNTSLSMYNSCSPSPSGAGNITGDPQLVDGLHLATTSPCRGAGATGLLSATDLDGDAWLMPPPMGCDEFNAAALVGPLLVSIESPTNTIVNRVLALTGRIKGHASRAEWNYGDGVTLTNGSYIASHTWTNSGSYAVTFTAFNTDNPNGVSATAVIHVDPVFAPALSGVGFATGTNFQFQFVGQPGANYWVEYATNLSPPISWLVLKSLTGTGGVEQIMDTKATNTARFYRVRAQ